MSARLCISTGVPRYADLRPLISLLILIITVQELGQPLDSVELRGRVSALREWHEGYEELESIDHSFAVEFKDRGPWSMFCDSEEDKVRLLGLLHQAAGLKL